MAARSHTGPGYRPILIGCPELRKLVRGKYLRNGDGVFRVGLHGEFLLELVRCNHDEGRCMQTLCALHRYNRRGAGTWYPDRVLALPDRRPRRKAKGSRPRAKGGDGSMVSYRA
jgi:hypothetical protein